LAYEEKYKKRMALGQDGNQLVNLIAIVAIVFVLLKFVYVIYKLTLLTEDDYKTNVFNYFILPGNMRSFLHRPWTILTYMFVHGGVMRVLGNLLWLWAFGFIIQDLMGNRKIIPLFIYGGVLGGIFFILTYTLFFNGQAQSPTLEGASAGILAIAVASTMLSPRYRIFPMLNGGIPLWVLTFVFVIIDFAGIPIHNTPEQMAHATGVLTGFFFIFLLRKDIDLSSGMNNLFDRIGNLFNPSNKPEKKEAQQHFYKLGGTDPYKKVPNITQHRIDSILDKISQKGYRSLSEEEKEILKRASENDNL
jgi:membrane associated rhomboid family serine protease